MQCRGQSNTNTTCELDSSYWPLLEQRRVQAHCFLALSVNYRGYSPLLGSLQQHVISCLFIFRQFLRYHWFSHSVTVQNVFLLCYTDLWVSLGINYNRTINWSCRTRFFFFFESKWWKCIFIASLNGCWYQRSSRSHDYNMKQANSQKAMWVLTPTGIALFLFRFQCEIKKFFFAVM